MPYLAVLQKQDTVLNAAKSRCDYLQMLQATGNAKTKTHFHLDCF